LRNRAHGERGRLGAQDTRPETDAREVRRVEAAPIVRAEAAFGADGYREVPRGRARSRETHARVGV
jgi:hypothetical protein